MSLWDSPEAVTALGEALRGLLCGFASGLVLNTLDVCWRRLLGERLQWWQPSTPAYLLAPMIVVALGRFLQSLVGG